MTRLTYVEQLSAVAKLLSHGGGRKKVHCLNNHSIWILKSKEDGQYLRDNLLDVTETILRACQV